MGSRNIFLAFLGAFIFIGFSNCQEFTPEDLTVDVPVLGKIFGRNVSTTAEGEDQTLRRPYIQFLGIPYGRIPERFRPSELIEEPLNATGDTYQALTAGLQCWQPNGIEIFLSEDCLSINVYIPRKWSGNDSDLLPVIFFIHGGAFTVGSGSSFSPIRLLNRDVVYVSFNYRLGLAGFYCLQNDDVPGNAAMYDVVNALTWVNRYIRYFGGNPNLVTIAGQSAGSVTVTHLLTSPMAQGMFHRAIAASGSSFNAWGTTTDPLTESLRIANLTGCYDMSGTPDLAAVANCMRTITPAVMVSTLLSYQISERQQGRLGFEVISPVVQTFPMSTYPKFMVEHPKTIMERGEQANVPLLMGSTRHDGSYVLGVFYNRFLKDNGLEANATFLSTELVPSMLRALGIDDYPGGIYNSLAQTYLQDAYRSGDFMELYPGLIDLFSVFFFKGGCYNTALLQSKVNNVYWYSFDFRGQASLFQSLYPGGEVPPFPGGITHSDDLIYTHLLTFMSFNAIEYSVSSRMLDYWSNFAATGNPTPDSSSLTNWPELSMETGEGYMSINAESVVMTHYPNSWVGPGLETVPVTTEPPATTTEGPTPTRIITSPGPVTQDPGNTSPVTTAPGGTTPAATTPTTGTGPTDGNSSANHLQVSSIVLAFVYLIVTLGY